MSEPYRVEIQAHGCPLCQSDAEWDIIGPNKTAQSQTWGDAEEATYICSLLNIAYAQGRVSYAEEVVERLKGDIHAKEQVEKAIEELPPVAPQSDDDIPF